MDELRWHVDGDLRDDLDRPIVAVAYRGLFDASGAATGAVTWLSERFDATVVGDVDPETFYDFTQERPLVMFDGDGERHLHWASNEVLVAHEGTPRDLVAESVVTLGAMAGMAPHSRPLAVVASSTNPRLADRLGLERPSYQGPTGLIGVLHDALDRAGVPVISLRVAVPHYVPDTPSPRMRRPFERWSRVTACMAVAVGVRADIWTMPVPSRIRSVWEASQASGVKASDPHDSAVQTASNPSRSPSWTRGTRSVGGCAPQ